MKAVIIVLGYEPTTLMLVSSLKRATLHVVGSTPSLQEKSARRACEFAPHRIATSSSWTPIRVRTRARAAAGGWRTRARVFFSKLPSTLEYSPARAPRVSIH